MIGMPNINQYFKIAMGYPVAKLQAVMRGQDKSIPMLAAMAAFEVKGPMEIAAKAQQAMAQKSTVNVREKLAQEGEEEKNGMLPDNLMMAMQQQQQGSLPENTGIGQLPAPNMQGMGRANGGIIAFDDGGEVPGYAGEDGSFVSSVGDFFGNLMPKEYDDETKQRLNAIDSERRAYNKQLYDIAGPSGRGAKTPEQQMAADKLKARIEQLDRDFMSTKFSKAKTKAEGKKAKVSDANEARISKPYPSNVKPKAVDPTAGQAVTDANANPFYVPPDALPAEKPTAPPTEKRSGIAAITPQTGRPGGKSDLDAALEASSKLGGGAETEYKAKLANYGSEATAVMNKLALEREQGKPTGQAYSGLEASLKKDEEAVKGKEAKNLQMALINAGLAIAGGTSRYAMENIGKGAMVGTKQYMEGVDKLEAAAKERQKAMAMIEQERRAEARGDWKDKNEFAAKRAEFELNAKKFGVEGVGKIFEVGKRSATDLYNTMSTNASRERMGQEQNATELKKAGIMAAAYGQRANDPMTLKKAAMDDALQAWTAEQKDKTFMLLKPEQKALRQRQIYERTFGAYGLPSPFGGGSAPAGNAPAGGGQRPPLSQRTDLFQ
jgi:hypothetical protein